MNQISQSDLSYETEQYMDHDGVGMVPLRDAELAPFVIPD